VGAEPNGRTCAGGAAAALQIGGVGDVDAVGAGTRPDAVGQGAGAAADPSAPTSNHKKEPASNNNHNSNNNKKEATTPTAPTEPNRGAKSPAPVAVGVGMSTPVIESLKLRNHQMASAAAGVGATTAKEAPQEPEAAPPIKGPSLVAAPASTDETASLIRVKAPPAPLPQPAAPQQPTPQPPQQQQQQQQQNWASSVLAIDTDAEASAPSPPTPTAPATLVPYSFRELLESKEQAPENETKKQLYWRRFCEAVFVMVACCIRCVGPV